MAMDWTELGSAVINGVAVGLLYGLLALVIVLLLRTTGLANFAQGSLGMFGAFIIYLLAVRGHLDITWAILVGVAASIAFGVVLYATAIHINEAAGHVNLTIRTVGLYTLLSAVVVKLWGAGEPFTFPRVYPEWHVKVATVPISAGVIAALIASLGLGLAFTLWLRYTHTGLMMRAAAENPEIAQMLGVNVRRLSAIAWALSAGVGTVVGALVAEETLLSSSMMDTYLLFAFVAAMVGGLTSLPGAIVGGLIVGVGQSLITVFGNSYASIVFVFLLLLGILLIRPTGLFGSREAIERL
jgi:branched-chain amino acid transport system permease protein